MPTLLPEPFDHYFMTFFFVFVRVSAAVFNMPVFSGRSVPRPIRAGIAFWVAVVVMAPSWGLNESIPGSVLVPEARNINGMVDLFMAAGSEVIIGISIGFIAQMMIYAIGLTGEVIGQQSGLSAATVFDPISGRDNGLMIQLQIWFAVMLFICIDGPNRVLEVVAYSFQVVQPGEAVSLGKFGTAGMAVLIEDGERVKALASILYSLGIELAFPLVATMIMVSLSEAFIARAVPQMNIMSIGFAIRLAMSFFFLSMYLDMLLMRFTIHLEEYQKYAVAWLSYITPTP